MALNDLQDKMNSMKKIDEPLSPMTPRKEELEALKKAANAPTNAIKSFSSSISENIKKRKQDNKIKDQVLNERSEGKSVYKNGKIIAIVCRHCGNGQMKKHTKRPGIGLQILASILLISGIFSFLTGGFILVAITLIINFYSKNMWKYENCKCTLSM